MRFENYLYKFKISIHIYIKKPRFSIIRIYEYKN